MTIVEDRPGSTGFTNRQLNPFSARSDTDIDGAFMLGAAALSRLAGGKRDCSPPNGVLTVVKRVATVVESFESDDVVVVSEVTVEPEEEESFLGKSVERRVRSLRDWNSVSNSDRKCLKVSNSLLATMSPCAQYSRM